MNIKPVGLHIIADLQDIDESLISNTYVLQSILEEAVEYANLTKINSHYHQFYPKGVTGVILLAESHISIHTWPEHNLATIDIYTCGDITKAEICFNYIIEKLNATITNLHVIKRGFVVNNFDIS